MFPCLLDEAAACSPGSRSRRALGGWLNRRLRYDARVAVAAGPRVVLRQMRLHEIEALAALIPETSTAQLANRWREQSLGYRELYAAERDGTLAGTVSIAETSRPPDSLHLFALEVAEIYRNQGIGHEIVRWVMEEARRRGRTRVFLEVRVDNPARRLYHRLGFRRVGPEFTNAWWQFNDDGTQERVEETSVRMVKRV
jgi:ribosomal protein S18 acetylase RimI-like enzyme